MVKVSMKVLIGIAVGLQFISLLVAVLLTCFPQVAYKMTGLPPHISERVIPVTTFLSLIVSFVWLIVVAIFVLFTKKVTTVGKVVTVVAFVLFCLTNTLLSYGYLLENYIWGRYGAYHLAALSAIKSAISLFTAPINTMVFALFAMVIGGYLWQKTDKS